MGGSSVCVRRRTGSIRDNILWGAPFELERYSQVVEACALITDLRQLARADLTLGCKTFGKNNTAMHQATIMRDTAMIKLLAQYGADVDAPGRDGWTPLSMAVRSNAVSTAKALIEAKASVHATSANGKTALDIATANKKGALAQEIQRSVRVRF